MLLQNFACRVRCPIPVPDLLKLWLEDVGICCNGNNYYFLTLFPYLDPMHAFQLLRAAHRLGRKTPQKFKMGGCGSKHHSHLETVDDSVHVMLKHDKKKQKEKGQAPHGYVPR